MFKMSVILKLSVSTKQLKCSNIRKCEWQEIRLITVTNNTLITPTIVLITGHFLNSAKFRGNIKILRQRANSVAGLEIPQPMVN